jgi:uncharacterized protein
VQKLRSVLDTSTLIGCLLKPASVPARALQVATQAGDMLASADTLQELETVLSREHFGRWRSLEERASFLRIYREACLMVEGVTPVQACRDPKDDKFLALCQHGNAGVLVSSDRDLLDMGVFGNTQIISPAEFLQRLRTQ